MSSVYKVNKGINKAVEFKGLKAQYIIYLAVGLVCLMILFAILYIIGVNAFVCVGLTGCTGGVLFGFVYRLSNRYGEHGLMKKLAKKKIPKVVKCYSRTIFINIRNEKPNYHPFRKEP